MSNVTNLAELLKHYRDIRGLSQRELADLSGVTKKTIEVIEAGTNINPTLDTLTRISTVLATPNPQKIHDNIEWEKQFPLISVILFRLLTFDHQSIQIFNQMLPNFHSIVQIARGNKE